MKSGDDGLPDPADTSTLIAGAANPVDLETGPDGDLFYADLSGGTIHRISYTATNQPPVADVSADPTSGNEPVTVNFDGTGSTHRMGT